MHIFREIEPLKAYLRQHSQSNRTIGLVPTMGALHEGHTTLVVRAKKENDVVVCSIFVNPTQFNNPTDLQKYPRNQDLDFKVLESVKCDAAFCPSDAVMYPEPTHLKFDLGKLDKILEGEFRPGHFSGVALVVSKLFNIVRPTRAYFGQKDYQQFMVITRLVGELKFEVELIAVPIVRESDGLAMSSRNMRLNAQQRKDAVILSECLHRIRKGLLAGQSFPALKRQAFTDCLGRGVKIDYLALAHKNDLTLLDEITQGEDNVLLIAAYVGEVRLIDNLFIL